MRKLLTIVALMLSFLFGINVGTKFGIDSSRDQFQLQIDNLKQQVQYTKSHCVFINGGGQEYKIFNPSKEGEINL